MVGRGGTFDAAVDGVKAARRAGFQVYTNTTFYRHTDLTETEALFTFLFAASMYFLVKGLFSGRVLDFALAGLVMGLAILCRASFQYYVLLIPVVLLVALKDFKRAAWHSLAYLVPVLFLLGGWCLRNQRTHGFFGLTSVGGINFIAGLNPPPSSYDLRDPFEKALLEACNSPATRTIASVIPPSGQGRMVFKSGTVYCTNEAAKTLLDQGYSLAEVDREFTRIALKQVRKAPVRYLKRAGAQGIALWSGYQTDWLGGSFEKTLQENVRDRDHVAAAVKVIFRLVLGASVFIMTAVGIGAMIKNGFRMGWVPVSTFTYLTAVCAALNLGYIRYRIPLEPYIVMTCLYGLSFLCNRFPVLRGGRG
jgi:hypothetical protein